MGDDPAAVWRGVILPGDPVPPDPFPSRVEAFVTACAMYSGLRERDVMNLHEALGGVFGEDEDADG